MHPRLHLREGQWSGGYCLSVGESNARYSASRLSSPRFCRVKIYLTSGITLHPITFSIRLLILFHQKLTFYPGRGWPYQYTYESIKANKLSPSLRFGPSIKESFPEIWNAGLFPCELIPPEVYITGVVPEKQLIMQNIFLNCQFFKASISLISHLMPHGLLTENLRPTYLPFMMADFLILR